MRIFKKLKPSDVLIRYVDGTGTEYELDDIISQKKYGELHAEFINPLMEISDKYCTDKYPVGISNPESYDDLMALALRLRDMGL